MCSPGRTTSARRALTRQSDALRLSFAGRFHTGGNPNPPEIKQQMRCGSYAEASFFSRLNDRLHDAVMRGSEALNERLRWECNGLEIPARQAVVGEAAHYRIAIRGGIEDRGYQPRFNKAPFLCPAQVHHHQPFLFAAPRRAGGTPPDEKAHEAMATISNALSKRERALSVWLFIDTMSR